MNVEDLGQLSYLAAERIQEQLLEKVVAREIPNTLLLTEHHPVYTLGANFHPENLLFSIEKYEAKGIQVEKSPRGGDVTFHGPGQLVIYPIFSLDLVNRDLHRWMRNLEEIMLQTLSTFGINARRFSPHTGAWVGDLKVAAIGVKVRRWVSMHGIALNCNNDLAPFKDIVPCGIQDYGVTSISELLGRNVSIEEAKPAVIQAFRDVFSQA